MPSPPVHLLIPNSPELIMSARDVFLEYAQSLSIDLAFQGFPAELNNLPGCYAAPKGQLLLASIEGAIAGCGAFCPRPEVDYPNACEMCRLYVRTAFRRFGLGRLLAQALMDDARRAGYSVMLLDALNDMEAARSLYTSLGFRDIPPYYFNPIAGAHYLKVDLDWSDSR
jgi:putative acetyltransferase